MELSKKSIKAKEGTFNVKCTDGLLDETLSLGHDPGTVSTTVQHNCLEMSRESGLKD